MAKILNELHYARPMNTYTGIPVDEVKTLNKDAAEQYNTNRQSKDALDVLYNNLDVSDKDYEIKKKSIEGVKEKFKDLVSKGNYQDARYTLAEAVKNFQTDNELQAALKSRVAERDFYAKQKERLDKGEITQHAYQYALNKTNLSNRKQIEYDPATMTAKNTFSGHAPLKDLSEDISKDVFDKIKDWKENGTMTVEGKTFTISSAGGVEKVLRDGKEVPYDEVASALKQHVQNQEKYKEYLNQEREINKFNKLTDAEGNTRLMNRQDLGMFSDNEIKQMYLGASEDQIKALENSKSLSDKASAKKLREAEANFNPNDPQTLENIHDSYAQKDQLDRLVYPAAEKASFRGFEHKLFSDQAGLEELKFRHAKALKKYEKDLEKQYMPMITNASEVQKYTGTDYATLSKNVDTYKADVAQKKALLDSAPKNSPLYATRLKDFQDAENTLTGAKQHIESLYTNLTDKAKENIQGRILGMFSQQEGGTSNWDYRISKDKLNELMNTARQLKDNKTLAKLATAEEFMSQGKQINEEWATDLAKSLVKPEYLPTLNDADSERVSRSTMFGQPTIGEGDSGFQTENSEAGNFLGLVGGAVLHHPSMRTTISNIMQEEFETNNNIKTVHDVVSVPDVGKDNTPIAKQYHGVSRALLANATEITTPDGNTLDDLISNKTDKKFYKYVTNNGKTVKVETTPDVNKTQVALAPGSSDGIPRLALTFKDADGADLQVGEGDESTRKAFFVKTGNVEAAKLLYKIGAEYAKETNDLDKYYSLQGEANYGQYFRPIRIGIDSDVLHVQSPDGKQIDIKMKKIDNDASEVIDAKTGKPLFGGKVFRSKSDLIKTFEKATSPVKTTE